MTHRVRKFTAGDVIDQQTDMVSRLRPGGPLHRMMLETLRIEASRGLRARSSDIDAVITQASAAVHGHLLVADTYRVSADMIPLVERAAALLNDIDRFSTDLLPTPCGFVRLESPLTLTDIRNERMSVDVITWGPAPVTDPSSRSTLFTLWSDISHPDVYIKQILGDIGTERYRREFGAWSYISANFLSNDMRVGPELLSVGEFTGEANRRVRTCTNMNRQILALLMLMTQTIVSVDTERPNAHARKRRKASHVRSTSDVRVVALRRARVDHSDETRTTGESHVEWHSRWVVRGHWRQQRVGQGRRETRRTWVSGYIKGPADKPLVATKTVFDLRR